MQAIKPLESTAKALTYLQAHNLPTTMEERVADFVTRPCGACGSYDWMIDPEDGLLICPCVGEARIKNKAAATNAHLAHALRTSSVRSCSGTSTANAWNERTKYYSPVGKRASRKSAHP